MFVLISVFLRTVNAGFSQGITSFKKSIFFGKNWRALKSKIGSKIALNSCTVGILDFYCGGCKVIIIDKVLGNTLE